MKHKENKINTIFQFTVEGNFDFPFDMLRYDRCWPSHESTVTQIAPHRPGKDKRIVQLSGLRTPTVGRWSSFGWKVTEVTAVNVS
jgi:hypothetical protein